MSTEFSLSLTDTVNGTLFAFVGRELPEHIRFGAAQKLVVHELVGGGRAVEALGRQPQRLEWSGLFLGAAALERAQALDSSLKSGHVQQLVCGSLRYRVVIAALSCEFQRFYQLPYTLTLEVLDDTQVLAAASVPALVDSVNNDMASAQAAAVALANTAPASLQASAQTVAKRISALQGLVQSLTTAARASQSVLNAVLGPVHDVRQQVGTLLAATNNLVQNVTTLGGLLPNNPAARQASGLLDQANAMNSLPALVQLDTALGRVQNNVQQGNAAPATVTVMPGASLYDVAAEQYGDASRWQVIAGANGLSDPMVPGASSVSAQAQTPPQAVTLVIPPASSVNTGAGHA
jgi:hypothetical protein